jgi:hypothetical protein
MPVLTQNHFERRRLTDEAVRAVVRFLQSKDDGWSDADIKKMVVRSALNLSTGRLTKHLPDRERDGSDRVSVSMTGTP